MINNSTFKIQATPPPKLWSHTRVIFFIMRKSVLLWHIYKISGNLKEDFMPYNPTVGEPARSIFITKCSMSTQYASCPNLKWFKSDFLGLWCQKRQRHVLRGNRGMWRFSQHSMLKYIVRNYKASFKSVICVDMRCESSPERAACISLQVVLWSFTLVRGQLQLWNSREIRQNHNVNMLIQKRYSFYSNPVFTGTRTADVPDEPITKILIGWSFLKKRIVCFM